MALLCAAGLLAALVLLPWQGPALANNAARLLADHLFGASAPPLLWVLPLIALGAAALSLWGLAEPDRAGRASIVNLLLGVLGLLALLINAGLARWAALGLGQWLALACALGLVGQYPWSRHAATGRRLPAVHLQPRALPYLFLAPGFALYLFWIIGPALYTVYLSLTDWDGVSPARFVGLENFRRLLFEDALFGEALTNNLRWLAIFITVPVVAGFALALAFHAARRVPGIVRAGFYAPLAFSFPVIGLVWAWLYNPRLGLINGFLAGLGVNPLPGWLADPQLAIWCIIAAAAWRQVGYVLLLYLAGLQSIDPSLIDAAVVDGASPARLLRHVLLPLLSPVTSLVLIIAVIDSLRAFDMVQVMTRGGQGTHVLATFMYLEAFINYRLGYGAAIAVALFAVSSLGVGAYLARTLRAEASA